MSMPIHVVTVVGGPTANILPHTIRHYQDLGVRSFFVIVHMRTRDDEFVARIRSMAAVCGTDISDVVVDNDLLAAKRAAIRGVMSKRPHDWFLPIDCDELAYFPLGLASTIEHCQNSRYDYICGHLIDRVSVDGRLTALGDESSIWSQYPLGGLVTYPILRGDPRKIVAARGFVALSEGHHFTSTGRACPKAEHYIQVHHFKWVATLMPYLRDRRDHYQALKRENWVESARFVNYYEERGRIDIADSRLFFAPCVPDYPLWDRVWRAAMAGRELWLGD
jgi:hypothetical protein